MIYGNFDSKWRPYVNGEMRIQEARLRKNVSFLLDTGASDIIISSNDAKSLGVDYHRLAPLVSLSGIGGAALAHPGFADMTFVGKGVIYKYSRVPIYILEASGNATVPSLLGQEMLKRWKMTFCFDTSEIIISPRRFDARIP